MEKNCFLNGRNIIRWGNVVPLANRRSWRWSNHSLVCPNSPEISILPCSSSDCLSLWPANSENQLPPFETRPLLNSILRARGWTSRRRGNDEDSLKLYRIIIVSSFPILNVDSSPSAHTRCFGWRICIEQLGRSEIKFLTVPLRDGILFGREVHFSTLFWILGDLFIKKKKRKNKLARILFKIFFAKFHRWYIGFCYWMNKIRTATSRQTSSSF